MLLDILNASTPELMRKMVSEIENCNSITQPFGLLLTHKDAVAIAQTRSYALRATGRIEFGSSIVDKLIIAICDSPYITTENYVETIHELIEMFYFYKNETLDRLSDDDLIDIMVEFFNGSCEGSLDFLRDRELADLTQGILNGNFGNEESEVEAAFKKLEKDEEEYD